jgi:alpha-D-ribose 1-methylphosphonate 5-triphosphate synthase subunit PhnL
MASLVRVENLHKTFTLHNQGGIRLPVLRGMNLEAKAGECLVIAGPSGSGKSTLLRSLWGNYKPEKGNVWVRHEDTWIDMAGEEPQIILKARKHTMGYVSQFLRVIPRVPALDILVETAKGAGTSPEFAEAQAVSLLVRLGIPERLWKISPTTFSGGEQQRINIARGFMRPYPILLLDEPTAALDGRNRQIVVQLIQEAKSRGVAVIGIFHDREVRDAVATRILEMPENGGSQ